MRIYVTFADGETHEYEVTEVSINLDNAQILSDVEGRITIKEIGEPAEDRGILLIGQHGDTHWMGPHFATPGSRARFSLPMSVIGVEVRDA